MNGKAGYLVGVLVGVIAAPVLGWLLLESATDLQRIAVFDSSPAGFPSMSTAGSATGAVLLAAAAVIAGLLAGMWRAPAGRARPLRPVRRPRNVSAAEPPARQPAAGVRRA
jgi:hypothetical protein